MLKLRLMVLGTLFSQVLAFQAVAGPIFLTGHDPDFHAQGSVGAQNLLQTGLDFVTGNTTNTVTEKFLWVESRIAPPGGHLIGEAGLNTLGLSLGLHYDRVNGAEIPAAVLTNYTAVVVASSFGGLLTRAELDALIARSTDIASFVNGGGGLMALAECFPCGANLLGGPTAPNLFGFVPLPGVQSVATSGPYQVTPTGAAAPYNLTNGDVNDPTHNAFSTVPNGLAALDIDTSNGLPVILAGNTTIGSGGFGNVPEPPAVVLLGLAMLGLVRLRMRG